MNKYNTIILLVIGIFSSISYADVLLIKRIQNSQSVSTPSRGITMNQVVSQFGEPELKKSAIGEPPITEWKYKKFSVYFEHKWVITSVVYKASPEEKGPKYIN